VKGLTDQLDGKGAGMKQASEELAKQLKDLPPERLALIERQLQGNPLFNGGDLRRGRSPVGSAAAIRE
jgi:hypothetical protein